MIQDIFPHTFDNTYNKDFTPNDKSYIFIFDKDKIYLEENDGQIQIPVYKSIKKLDGFMDGNLTYLFTIDENKFFLIDNADSLKKDQLKAESFSVFRKLEVKEDWAMFAVATAMHLYKWYSFNKYCGRCGKPNEKDEIERALYCPCCNTKIYPTIAPVIMVGIVNGDKLLLTKYAKTTYNHYSLVAGFVEIGEALEDTVRREVMEEVGLKVKNIRYYKSQPWAYTNTIISGFFAELDGIDEIDIDTQELGEAKWFRYDELETVEPIVALSEDMIAEFKNKKGNV